MTFMVGVAVLALTAGAVGLRYPSLFMPLVAADLWFLGYHHVVATYTRLCFDRESLRTHRFLIWILPMIVLAGTLVLAFGVGLWSLTTLYFYWQWFHYARQSWGVSQAYRRKAGKEVTDSPRLSELVFYLLPVWGIVHRSWQNPTKFLGLDFRMLPMPRAVEQALGAAALVGVAWWIVTRVRAWRRGELPIAHTIFMLSHFTIFYVAYIAIDDVSVGWLVTNVWHNAQYILFVWVFNNRKFEKPSEAAPFLSKMSRSENVALYFGVCMVISTGVYLLLGQLAMIVAPVVIYQVINFHHYLVDSVIWKLRKPSVRSALQLDA